MTKVKICGITNLDDAVMAAKLGADALGFIFAPSPRRIEPAAARDIIRNMPPFIKNVGVFVNEETKRVTELIEYCGLDIIQFHGDESPETCAEFMPRTIKALRVKDETILEKVPLYTGRVKALLLDAYSENRYGGTGIVFNWEIANKVKAHNIPVILAGGLTPLNIEEAIQRVMPYAVDMVSGIEESPGKKDHRLMKELFERIHK